MRLSDVCACIMGRHRCIVVPEELPVDTRIQIVGLSEGSRCV